MKYSIKRLLAALTLATLMAALSGCYIAPGYGYVQRNGVAGDAYYGTGPAVVYSDPYYGYGYYPGYWGGYYGGWGGYYGCCWRGGYYGRGHYSGGGGWHGGHGGGWSGGHGGWHGGSGGGGHWHGH